VPKAIEEPTPSDVREGAQEEWGLNKQEYEKFTIRLQAYERKETKRLRLQKAMARMNSLNNH
jgi:hypothetical protein